VEGIQPVTPKPRVIRPGYATLEHPRSQARLEAGIGGQIVRCRPTIPPGAPLQQLHLGPGQRCDPRDVQWSGGGRSRPCPPGCSTLKRLHYHVLGTCIQPGRRLVQYQDGSVSEDRASDGNRCFWPPDKVRSASFRNHGLISIGQPLDEFVGNSPLRLREPARLSLQEN